MEYYSAIKRNAFESVLIRWMNLEPIIQTEINQKEENKYPILTLMYRIWKDGTDEPICRAGMETDTGNRLGDTGEGTERVGRVERAALKGMHFRM